MISPYRLRPALPEDAEAIIAWFPTHDSAVLWGGPEVPEKLTTGWFAGQYADPIRRHYALADAADRPCGYFVLRPVPAQRRLHLGRFAVAPDRRGLGLGALMIGQAQALAREAGAGTLTLYVYEHNARARLLYERCGFIACTPWPGETVQIEGALAMACAIPSSATAAGMP